MFTQQNKGFGSFGQHSAAFGSTAATPFGAATGTTSTFGSTPAATAGGLFGAAATTTAGSMFGTQSAFGRQQTATVQPSAFSFGTQPQTGLFGATSQPASSGIFGTPTTNTAFGAKTPAQGFGATTQPSSLFSGTTTGATSLFGSTAAAPSGGLFGNTAGKIGFGGATVQAAGTVVKFVPLPGSENMVKSGQTQTVTTRHQCLTAMKEYESKSLEELRQEDYEANRKGPQAGSVATGGLFGAAAQPAATGFGGFGQAKPTGFTLGFGSTATPAATPFGAQPTSAAATGSLFGAATAGKSLFGATTTTATATPAFGSFATNTGTSLFGANANKAATTQSTGLFGAAQPAASAFGSTGFATTNAFGSTQPAGGLFGQKTVGFGTPASSSTLTFGQTNNSSLFAKPATSGFGGFGTSTNIGGFGTAQTGGLFANKAPAFGATATATPLGSTTGFGMMAGGLTGTLGGPTGSLFGNTAKPMLGTTGAFGGFGGLGGTSTAGGLGGLTANTGLATSTDILSAQQAQVQQQLLALTSAPYGDSPLFRNLKQDDSKREEVVKPTNPAAQKAALASSSQYKVSPRLSSKVKPRPLHSIANGKTQLFDGLEEDDASSFGNDSFVARQSVKKLMIRKTSSTLNDSVKSTSPAKQIEPLAKMNPGTDALPVFNMPAENHENRPPNEVKGRQRIACLDNTIVELNTRAAPLSSLDRSYNSADDDGLSGKSDPPGSVPPEVDHPTRIVLTRPGYYTLPSLDELAALMEGEGEGEGDCVVENFVVGREGFGNVLFPGLTNVAGLNLDEIVHFRRKEVTIYPDDDRKPPVGEELNKKAQVTLDCVWPIDKCLHTPIKNSNRLDEIGYQDKLERASARIGAVFIDYRPESGSWVFEVKHFSKYGLLDDSDDDDDDVIAKAKAQLERDKLKIADAAGKRKPANSALLSEKELNAATDSAAKWPSKQVVAPLGSADAKLGSSEDDADMYDDDMALTLEDGALREQWKQRHDWNPVPEQDEMSMSDEDPMPSSYQIATTIGVRADELQLRKASFFGHDEDEEEGEEADMEETKCLTGRWPVTAQWQTSSSSVGLHAQSIEWSSSGGHQMVKRLAREVGKTVDMEEDRGETFKKPQSPSTHSIVLHSGIEPFAAPRTKLVGTRIHHRVVPLADSVLAGRESLLMDAGLMMGRSFRVGWGPGWTLAHCAGESFQWQPDGLLEERSLFMSPNVLRRQRNQGYPVTVETLQLGLPHDVSLATLKEETEEWLEVQLANSECSPEESCPRFAPIPGRQVLTAYANQQQNLVAAADASESEPMKYSQLVWELCVALWGPLTELLAEKGLHEEEASLYAIQEARKAAFSEWLKSAAIDELDRKKETDKAEPSCESRVFDLLTTHAVADACHLAQTECSDHRLALLLSQTSSNVYFRQMLARQLEDWQHCQVEPFLSADVVRLYCLMAGALVWQTPRIRINVCEGLDWRRCLAVHLWYKCPATATIADAVAEYETSFTTGAYSVPPLPPYVTRMDRPCRVKETDVCFHLMKLYADSYYSLQPLLLPTSSSPAHLDHRLSWHLLQALKALGYYNISDYHEHSLTTTYAAQLESMGMWPWAVFVLLHIGDARLRESLVKEVLQRHAVLHPSEKEEEVEGFLLTRLRIDKRWLHLAKSWRAHTGDNRSEEAHQLLEAGEWNRAHSVIIAHLAPDAIVNENYSGLEKMLLELKRSEERGGVENWVTEGKVYLDYINLMQSLTKCTQGLVGGYEMEQLQSETISLIGRVDQITCPTPLHRLCQSEMAKRADNLLTTLMTLQNPQRQIPIKELLSNTCHMQLPEDYALQKLGQMTRSYMRHLSAV